MTSKQEIFTSTFYRLKFHSQLNNNCMKVLSTYQESRAHQPPQPCSPTHLALASNATLGHQLVPIGKAEKEQKKSPQLPYLDSETRHFQLLLSVLRTLQEDSVRTWATELLQASLTMAEPCYNVMNGSSLHNRDAEKEDYSENYSVTEQKTLCCHLLKKICFLMCVYVPHAGTAI